MTLFILPLFAALLSGQAFAADSKVYSGGNCEAWAGSKSLNANAAYNNSSSTIKLDCPVILDADTHSSITSATMRVLDRHYSEDVKCSINVIKQSSSSTTTVSSSTKTSAGSSSSYQELSWTTATTSTAVSSLPWAFFSCEIPALYTGYSSYIYAYRVVEN